MLHIYLRDGSLKQRAETISKLDGILSVSMHVGNSDILAEFVYDNSECLVDTISEIKDMQDIEKVTLVRGNIHSTNIKGKYIKIF